MNIISAGSRFQVYGEDVKTYQKLPVGTYTVNCGQMTGFWLSERTDLTVTEDKIYGTTPAKIRKVMTSYNLVDRNFGVLLSGQKGIGKSLFVRLLAREAIAANLPVITVTEPYAGLATFLSSIEQDCVIVFDEFEKVFAAEEDRNPQDELLSLFDGLDGGHKLFIVTCNELENINQYMLNRPGRFHYHFTMEPPTATEIAEYMRDKLLPQYHNLIQDVVNIAIIADMPYDYLRAIAFELNQGYSLKEAMSDLNITRVDGNRFNVTIYLNNGLIYEGYDQDIDINCLDSVRVFGRRYEKDPFPSDLYTYIFPAKAQIVGKEFIISEGVYTPTWDSYDFKGENEEADEALAREWRNNVFIERVVLSKCPTSYVKRYAI